MRAVLALALVLIGCGDALELSVDVRTSLRAGVEVDQIRVELTPAGGVRSRPIVLAVDDTLELSTPVRVADYRDLPAGPTHVRAALDRMGAEVLAREVVLDLRSDYALTITLTADCAGVTCPGASDPPTHTQCVEGRCVPPECGGGSGPPCEDLACTSDAECVARLGCDVAHCELGMCLCDARDGGIRCPGECTAGEIGEETRACGMCAEGTERRNRTCGDNCAWGAWGEWGSCQTAAECTPGQTDGENRACGNCNRGTESRGRSCDPATCRWGAWAEWGTCAGGGACVPGATRPGCDSCGQEVCDTSCNWGGCAPRPGNACLHEAGTNYRCCGTRMWQYCLSSCQWSTACAPCTSCCP